MSGGKIKIELRFVDPVDECPEGRTENCNMPSYMGLVLVSTPISDPKAPCGYWFPDDGDNDSRLTRKLIK